MTILALGLNHHTAPLQLRERVVFAADILPDALADLGRTTGVEEATILSTCNRTEIYCSRDQLEESAAIDWLSGFHGLLSSDLAPYLYSHPDALAVRHVLRVASGLDSMVLGEPQVLGQLKNAYNIARRAGTVGQLLGRLFQYSFMVAKKVRSNTAIGDHPVSVAYAAVRLAQQIFGDLSRSSALLIGAGETIELVARHLGEAGLRRLIIANRTLEHSQHLAKEFAAYAVSLQDLSKHLDEVDIIISSTASPVPIVKRSEIEQALRTRKHRPVFIVDIAVPRDVEASTGELEDVYLYTVDDLREVIEDNMRGRRAAAVQAEEIIDTQVAHFMDWVRSRSAVPTLRAMHDKADSIKDEALLKAISRLKAGTDPEQVVTELSHTLTRKLIHAPSTQIRMAGARGRADLLVAARELFDLDPLANNDGDTDDPD